MNSLSQSLDQLYDFPGRSSSQQVSRRFGRSDGFRIGRTNKQPETAVMAAMSGAGVWDNNLRTHLTQRKSAK